MQQPPAPRAKGQPAGVIDTLSAGYAAINRQLWVLLVPVLFDLLLWLGPQVSVSPLVQPLIARGGEWVQQAAVPPPGTRGQAAPPPEASAEYETLTTNLRVLNSSLMSAADANLLGLLNRNPVLGLPSAMVLAGGNGSLRFVSSWAEGLALLTALLAGGLVAGGAFRAAIAQQVRDGRPDPLAATRDLPATLLRSIGLAFAVLAAALVLGMPLVLVMGLAALIAPALAAIGLLLVSVAVVFVEIHLFFALDAIFVSRVGPLVAVQRSVAVVRRAFWPTVALMLLTLVILAGMDRVWEMVMRAVQAPFGVLLGILGNAYIASGLVAASMIFYKERAEAAATAPTAHQPVRA